MSWSTLYIRVRTQTIRGLTPRLHSSCKVLMAVPTMAGPVAVQTMSVSSSDAVSSQPLTGRDGEDVASSSLQGWVSALGRCFDQQGRDCNCCNQTACGNPVRSGLVRSALRTFQQRKSAMVGVLAAPSPCCHKTLRSSLSGWMNPLLSPCKPNIPLTVLTTAVGTPLGSVEDVQRPRAAAATVETLVDTLAQLPLSV